MRGQTELPALAIAFVLLTSTVVAGVVLADSALSTAERPALEQQTAMTLSDQLVDERASHTVRENVLVSTTPDLLDERVLRNAYKVPDDADVSIRIDGETVVETGPVSGGTTVERIVLVERRTHETIDPDFERSRTVTLPRRTSTATLTIDPPRAATVQRVYANDRVVLANEDGLEGTFDVSLSPFATTTLYFDAVGVLDDETVRIEYEPPETRKALLQVTVDA